MKGTDWERKQVQIPRGEIIEIDVCGPEGQMEGWNQKIVKKKKMHKKPDHLGQIEASHVRGKSFIISVICLTVSLHVVDKPPAWGHWPGPAPDTQRAGS